MQYKSTPISSQNPKLSFACSNSNSGMNVYEISIPFLSEMQPHLWLGYLEGVSLKFTEICNTGETNSKHIVLAVTPYQTHPVFEFDFFVPEKNKDNFTSVGTYCDKLEIELYASGKTKEFVLYITYAEYPNLTII